MRARYRALILLAAGLSLVALSLFIGAKTITPAGMARLFIEGPGSIDYTIVVGLRLPRVILALVIGASLAVSGTVLQSVLKNPLADPYIIGLSGGAALGATVAIVSRGGAAMVSAAAFSGSLVAIAGVFLLSKRMRLGTTGLILSGIALGFILSSAVMLVYALSRSDQIHRAMLWLMGDLSGARYDMLKGLGILSLLLVMAAMMFHRHLDIISMGDRFSRSLGVTGFDVGALFWIASLLAALAVSLAGVVGFVGLIVPHVMRNIFGPSHLRLIPASAAGGALFLLVSDAIGRSIAPPFEIPVGIITGFLGGIFFLVHMIRRGGG